jgi:hypothetical protein
MFTLRFDMRLSQGAAAELYAAAIDMCAWAETRGAVIAVLSEHHGAGDGHRPRRTSWPRAIHAVSRRPDLDLVGVWVHSADKIGGDAGELAGGDPIGVTATNDADELIALKPACVVYAASGPERDAGAVPDYLKLLAAGINVVSTTSTSLVYPPAYFSPDWRDQIQEAAKAGNSSFYASGIFPGLSPISLRCC